MKFKISFVRFKKHVLFANSFSYCSTVLLITLLHLCCCVWFPFLAPYVRPVSVFEFVKPSFCIRWIIRIRYSFFTICIDITDLFSFFIVMFLTTYAHVIQYLIYRPNFGVWIITFQIFFFSCFNIMGEMKRTDHRLILLCT